MFGRVILQEQLLSHVTDVKLYSDNSILQKLNPVQKLKGT